MQECRHHSLFDFATLERWDLTLADLAEWHLDLEALARKFQQANRLKGMPGPLEDRLFFLGEASRNGSRLAFVLGLLHDPRSARTLLAALPEWLPASYSQIIVVCPTFALQPADAHRLERTKMSLASLDHADLFCLDSAVTPPAGENVFRKEGDYWNVRYLGTSLRLMDTRGLQYVAHLLRHPGLKFHVLELVEAIGSRRDARVVAEVEALQEGLRVSTLGDAGELVDAQAIAEYKTRLVELQDKLEEAERNNDTERAARLKEKMDPLLGQLSQALGLGGRRRRADSSAERARVNVGRQIRSAIGRIAEHDPALAGHLQKTIKTGFRCSYTPVSEAGWSF